MPRNTKIFDAIVIKYRNALQRRIKERKREMAKDVNTHFFLYRALGIKPEECSKIDIYQNVGRLVYKYAGAMLEELAVTAINQFVGGKKIRIPNKISTDPKKFEIDCFVRKDNKAHEIKWRDATTDGDHIKKEHNKILAILKAKMKPVRIMFFMPERQQAIKIQRKVISLYNQSGEAHIGPAAWKYIKDYTGVDLLAILKKSARTK